MKKFKNFTTVNLQDNKFNFMSVYGNPNFINYFLCLDDDNKIMRQYHRDSLAEFLEKVLQKKFLK